VLYCQELTTVMVFWLMYFWIQCNRCCQKCGFRRYYHVELLHAVRATPLVARFTLSYLQTQPILANKVLHGKALSYIISLCRPVSILPGMVNINRGRQSTVTCSFVERPPSSVSSTCHCSARLEYFVIVHLFLKFNRHF